jgi:Tol biopolymer transport system component
MLRNRRSIMSGLALASLAVLLVAQTTLATFPGRNGRITFMREDNAGNWQVWVADHRLHHARKLTDFDASSGWSAWSPDGSRLLFDSDLADPDRANDPFINDIFTMKPDGTDIRKLTDSVGYAGGAGAWSPDGKLIVFEADRGDYPAQAGIYVINARDGSNRRRLTTLPTGVDWDGAPKFSPDGTRILFTRFTSQGAAVHTMRLDGSDLRRVSPWELNANDADWSPDGTHIVFEAYPEAFPRGSAWIVGANGGGLTNLTPTPTMDGVLDGYSDPVFSPDGKQIILLHGLFYPDGRFTGGLASMRPDGSHLQYVTDGLGIEHQADWGPAVHG